MTTDFLITALIVVLIPGNGVVFTVSTGLIAGRRASVLAALGCTIGILPHLLAAVLGLAALLHTSAVAFHALKIAGTAYLFLLAYLTWRDRKPLAAQTAPVAAGARRLVAKALLLNILNPKLSIFFLAYLPQFIEPDAQSPLVQMMKLSAIFMAMTFAVFVVYGLLASGFRRAVIDSPHVQAWLRCSFSAAFAGLGLRLAFSDDLQR